MRRFIMDRDRGICQICGLDTLELKEIYDTAIFLAESEGEVNLIQDRLKALGFHPNRAIAEVDHLLPVAEGGGASDEANLRLLCYACHLKLSKADAKRRRGKKNSCADPK